MKKYLFFAGLVCTLLFVFYAESAGEGGHHPSARLIGLEEMAEETSGMPDDSYSSRITFEYIWKETKEIAGYTVQYYEEYEVLLDENGNELKRQPSGKIESIKYKKDQEE